MLSYRTNQMSVNHEVKGMLAKLLATEDLVIEHKKVDTACFNVHTRVLTLPLWERASNSVYDMLVAHECGHSIYTPDEDWSQQVKVPHQFVNVVEDARVEKLMKRKYPGLAKTFFAGYKELQEQDFFQVEGEDVSKMNLADRANLYFKVGNFLILDFNAEEKEIIDLISACETFADALIASEELYKYCKKEPQEKVSDIDCNETSGGSSSPTENSAESSETDVEGDGESGDSKSENSKNDGESVEKQPNSSGGSLGDNGNDEPEVKTVDNLEDKIRQLAAASGADNLYLQIPEVNLETVVIKNSEIHKEITSCFSLQQKNYNESGNSESLFTVPDTEFRNFKLSAQKEVSYLVKEFECRKSADAYARASTARTGVLDTARLHTYKFNEDLFKKVTVLPNGKNHGLIFVLDWSGSMSNVIVDTCKQLFNLIWFCKKVSIPFEVYAFTNEWTRPSYNYDTGKYDSADVTPHYEKKDHQIAVDDTFSMMNILTSKVSGSELERQLINIWRIASCYNNRYAYTATYSCPPKLSLSGTPLNESLITLHQIIPNFKKQNKLQKVQCVVLTDGEACSSHYHISLKRHYNDEPYFGVRSISNNNTFLRDRKLGTTYNLGGCVSFTDTFLRNLKDKFPYTNFIGIRVIASRDASRFINLYHPVSTEDPKTYNKIQDDWKKLKSFTITNSGYHAYFGISSSALSQDSEFDVSDNATKSQIKSAFAKSLKTKKFNKKVLGEFISLVA